MNCDYCKQPIPASDPAAIASEVDGDFWTWFHRRCKTKKNAEEATQSRIANLLRRARAEISNQNKKWFFKNFETARALCNEAIQLGSKEAESLASELPRK